MSSSAFVPAGFEPPVSLVADQFRLEPLSPRHNRADYAAWTSSIEHIRATAGYADGGWPSAEAGSLESNLVDVLGHAADFENRRGFTFTVLDPTDDDVIGCVYLYPAESDDHDVRIRSWVRADRSDLDVPLGEAVASWVAAEWPWQRPNRYGR